MDKEKSDPILNKKEKVGMTGFEPATPSTPC